MNINIKSQNQLVEFKAEVLKLYELVDKLIKGTFDSNPLLKIVATLLQNISFKDLNPHSLKSDVKQTNLKLSEIDTCCKYNDWYFTQFVISELYRIIGFSEMSEDLEGIERQVDYDDEHLIP